MRSALPVVPVRHTFFARLVAALGALGLTVALAAASGPPATAGPIKGYVQIRAVHDVATGLAGAVKNQTFIVDVQLTADAAGLTPIFPNQDITVTLSAGGPGHLGGPATGVIPGNTGQGTVEASYDAFGNAVQLTASAGRAYVSDTESIQIQASAVKVTGNPNNALTVLDPSCPSPTVARPICGFLDLPNGANGDVTMYLSSCRTIFDPCLGGRSDSAGVVTALFNLKDAEGLPLYDGTNPATFVLACDKSVCKQGGVSSFPVFADPDNGTDLQEIEDCPARGVLGPLQQFCRDTVASHRDNAGDTYTVVLFDIDLRLSHP